MDKDRIKIEREKLKSDINAAGFSISSEVNPSIELFLERTDNQKAIAAMEATWQKGIDPNSEPDPGFLCFTQDYLIFSKRVAPSLRSLIPFSKPADDIFYVFNRSSVILGRIAGFPMGAIHYDHNMYTVGTPRKMDEWEQLIRFSVSGRLPNEAPPLGRTL